MADIVKALLAAPVNAVLLVAGLAFLGVAVFRRITDRLDAGPKGRLFAGLLGAVLVALSLYLSLTGPKSGAAIHPGHGRHRATRDGDTVSRNLSGRIAGGPGG